MELILLVGPPGSGKSTYAKQYIDQGYTYINQDLQGKTEHFQLFTEAVIAQKDIIVDRMNFSKEQRSRYLNAVGTYKTKIVVLHESYNTCLQRCKNREHLTIKDEKTAKKVLNFFFSKYERVEDSEADEVIRIWPEGEKPLAIICDLDGTLCNLDHRLHYVKKEGKKDWMSFFEQLINDQANMWCLEMLTALKSNIILFCSGRPSNYRNLTLSWLYDYLPHDMRFDLFMRYEGDYRQDNIAKEILLDFEILTNYTPYFIIDDRKQVVDMWRKRGFTCLQCTDGEF